MLHGFATPQGTRLFAQHFTRAESHEFYRDAAGLTLSSVGLGTHAGTGFEQASLLALRSGINVFDTALSYREQQSERELRAGLRTALNANQIQRDQVFVATKAGFLVPGAIPEWLQQEDIAGAMHCLHPDFIEDQVNRSRANLDLDTLDCLYLQDPETQLRFASPEAVEQRLQLAFERLEKLSAERRIHWYGIASCEGFTTQGSLNLGRLIDLARYVGGEDHRFRFLQLPFNLGNLGAYVNRDEQGASVLKVAARAGLTVIASATLHQGQLTQLPSVFQSQVAGFTNDAARAIQFTRSTPGISIALVGMSSPEHIRENLEVAGVPPMGTPDYEKLYRPVDP